MPIDPPPSLVAAACDERLDELSPPSGAASARFYPEVFKVADHPAAECVRVKHIVRKAEQRAFTNGCTAHQSTHRMFGVHDPAP
jgi:hypothetical protein